MKALELSAVMVVGASRANAQRVLRFLDEQSVRDRMEVVIVDVGAAHFEPLGSRRENVKYIRQPGIRSWGTAKILGARAAETRIVAFLEDHCRPMADWAENLLVSFQGPWMAVGYAFLNGSPDSYFSRVSLMADYGLWVHPVRAGEWRLIPGNNVAYRREFMESLEPGMEKVMGVDFNLHEIILERGGKMYLEAKALAAHQCYGQLRTLLASNFVYARVLGATRARNREWGPGMRFLAGCAAPWLVPPLRLFRLLRSFAGREGMWTRLAEALPVVVLTYCVCAWGEARGYWFGMGDAEEQFMQYELDKVRI